ncbi:MAG TPA: hypothetical protein VFN32_06945 [Rhodococcus sp. (in: high G+C Gram-positive bacteria)]|nr:hypothetical protein [Rhodococcus sp. (in: high G+C Gram-positive bacteria)]
MIIIFGLVLLLAAVVIGTTGVLNNSGAAHTLTDDFAVFGYHVTGSTGVLFLYGIVVGAVGLLGLSVLLAGARRTSRRGHAARHDLKEARHETEVVSRDRDHLAAQREVGSGDLDRGETAPPSAARSHASTTGRDWRHPFGHRTGGATS